MRAALLLIALAFVVPTAAANATPITSTFTVMADSGPLTGTFAAGTFSFDSSSIVFGSPNNSAGFLTSFAFGWNGIAYTAATANTGGLTFDSAGTLVDGLIGDNCSAGGCIDITGTNNWSLFLDSSPTAFTYAVPGVAGIFRGHLTAFATPLGPGAPAAVPEPASLVLLGTGLVALARLRRRSSPEPKR